MIMVSHVNKIIVVEHPVFHHRHVLALVKDQTRSTYMLTYWDTKLRNWSLEDPKRRKIGYSKVLGSEDSILTFELQQIAEKLGSWWVDYTRSVEQLDREYFLKLEKLKVKQ